MPLPEEAVVKQRSRWILVGSAVVGLLPVTSWAVPAVMTMEVVDVDGSAPADPNEITVGVGAVFTIELQLEGWAEHGVLTGCSFGFDSSGFQNNGPGRVELASFSCTEDDECFAGTQPPECLDGLCEEGTRCDVAAQNCEDGGECVEDPEGLFCDCYASLFIDTQRPNYVYYGEAVIVGTDCRSPEALEGGYKGLSCVGAPGMPDQGGQYYIGTLIATMPSGACGDFTIALNPDPLRTCAKDYDCFCMPLDVTSTVMVHGPPCTEPGACCTGSVCTDGLTLGDCEAGGGVFRGEGLACGADVDGDGIDDACDNCERFNPDQADCQPNGIGDVCDIAEGTSLDQFPFRWGGDGVPDECQALLVKPIQRIGK